MPLFPQCDIFFSPSWSFIPIKLNIPASLPLFISLVLPEMSFQFQVISNLSTFPNQSAHEIFPNHFRAQWHLLLWKVCALICLELSQGYYELKEMRSRILINSKFWNTLARLQNEPGLWEHKLIVRGTPERVVFGLVQLFRSLSNWGFDPDFKQDLLLSFWYFNVQVNSRVIECRNAKVIEIVPLTGEAESYSCLLAEQWKDGSTFPSPNALTW